MAYFIHLFINFSRDVQILTALALKISETELTAGILKKKKKSKTHERLNRTLVN